MAPSTVPHSGANTQIRTDLVEIAVWHEVCQLLNEPHRLEQEYHRRGHARPGSAIQVMLYREYVAKKLC
jgi:hypothetical protein